jgi:hypothetical protein
MIPIFNEIYKYFTVETRKSVRQTMQYGSKKKGSLRNINGKAVLG